MSEISQCACGWLVPKSFKILFYTRKNARKHRAVKAAIECPVCGMTLEHDVTVSVDKEPS